MKRKTTRASLCSLLCGLLLVACGGAPEEAGQAPSGESLGTQESALCSTTSVSSLTISGISSWGGEMAGNGSWAVTGGANAVRLEYYVDGVLSSSEERTGTSGTWYFSQQGTTCGSHTFLVKAYAMVVDSAGNRTTCWSSPSKSVSQTVTQTCPTASLSCARTSTREVTCTGGASGGSGSPYAYFWQQKATSVHTWTEIVIAPWYEATSSERIWCPAPTSSTSYDTMRVELKVRDSSGMYSGVKATTFNCEAGTTPY